MSSHHHQEQKEEQNEKNDDDKDCFFETFDRVPSGISFMPDSPSSTSSSEQQEEDEDSRVSFASAIGPACNLHEEQDLSSNDEDEEDYNVWMEESMSVEERRRKLRQGMGLQSGRRAHLTNLQRAVSQRTLSETTTLVANPSPSPASPSPTPPCAPTIAHSRSHINYTNKSSIATEMASPLSRAYSAPSSLLKLCAPSSIVPPNIEREGDDCEATGDDSALALCRIKDLDTGKEFVVCEAHSNDGTRSRLDDIQSGLPLTIDELDKFLGYSPLVKQLMQRKNGSNSCKLLDSNSSKLNNSRKKCGGGWLKNINKFVTSSVTGLRLEKDFSGPNISFASMRRFSTKSSTKDRDSGSCSNERLKVRQYGKSYKELTGLYMCQELKGVHQDSIQCMKFSNDGQYLASAGKDQVVCVWAMSVSESNTLSRLGSSFIKQEADGTTTQSSKKNTRKGKKGIDDHLVFPEMTVSLSEKPICTFKGHNDYVLDLSWSRTSRYILSSSVDKTVRLWDVENKTCVKMFAHNDYVTSVQFNPVDERYFISGSLDEKVRIWSIEDRRVVDWVDLHEKVTATAYTPQADGALVGSRKGSCRFFTVCDGKLNQEAQVELKSNKRKSNTEKITGFQFAPGNSSEMIVTSADSLIRVFDGINMVHKFQGFKNKEGELSASYTRDGRYVVCASEDSHVYIWKRQPIPQSSSTTGANDKPKRWPNTRSHEHFYCKNVSVAIPWPGPPPSLPPSSFNGSEASSLNLSDESFPSSRSYLPPLPPKNKNSPLDTETNESDSFRSVLSSSRMFSPPPDFGGYTPNNADDSKRGAWGLVMVTASTTGDIRVYQNFGLPIRLNRQANLFS